LKIEMPADLLWDATTGLRSTCTARLTAMPVPLSVTIVSTIFEDEPGKIEIPTQYPRTVQCVTVSCGPGGLPPPMPKSPEPLTFWMSRFAR
jgi:hypothetical protein